MSKNDLYNNFFIYYYMENLIIREIDSSDFNIGYMDLMYEFTNFNYPMNQENFTNYLNNHKDNIHILVIYDSTNNKIIGAGSIFKINKLHNNPIGQIEDVIITKEYRKFGFGKLLINKLIDIGKNKFKCYKIILNCLEHNIQFYKNCNFNIVGVEMKLV